MCIIDWISDVCSSYLSVGIEYDIAVKVVFTLGHRCPFITDEGGELAGSIILIGCGNRLFPARLQVGLGVQPGNQLVDRSEEHTSELQSLMRISYAVFCLKKKKKPSSII